MDKKENKNQEQQEIKETTQVKETIQLLDTQESPYPKIFDEEEREKKDINKKTKEFFKDVNEIKKQNINISNSENSDSNKKESLLKVLMTDKKPSQLFTNYNSEIRKLNDEFTKEEGVSPIDKINDANKNKPVSFLSRSLYKTIVIMFVSWFWFIIWSAYGGWDKFGINLFSIYSGGIIILLLILLSIAKINFFIYMSYHNKKINYYIINFFISFLNYCVRILFILTPAFINTFLNADVKDATNAEIIGKLQVSTTAPTFFFSFYFLFLYLPYNYKNIIISIKRIFGIIEVLKHSYVSKLYLAKPTEYLFNSLEKSWKNLKLTYNKPIDIAYHPYAMKFLHLISTSQLTNDEIYNEYVKSCDLLIEALNSTLKEYEEQKNSDKQL